ncbi:ankyrin repeat-containing protein [Cucumis melo var. makuwa]|nr:ankyrin repeat-containing protein [Cucumis melo var. makuwa]
MEQHRVEVVVEHNLISPPSYTADDAKSEPTSAAHLSNCTTPEISRTIASDYELDSDTMEKNRVETSRRLLLYKSALKGDWKRAEFVLNDYPHYVRCAITRNKETVLHVAAGAKQSVFVEELVSRMTRNDMALRDKYGNTALCFAATSRIVKIAKLMVEKNHELPLIRTFREGTPLLIAVSYKSRDMISYLLSVTDLSQLTAQERIELLIATIHSDFHDLSLWILKLYPELAVMKDTKNNNETALHVLARKPSAMDSTKQLQNWKMRINSWRSFNSKLFISPWELIDEILASLILPSNSNKDVTKTLAHQLVEFLWRYVVYELPQKEMLEFIRHPTSLLNDAAGAGNVEFLIVLIREYPDILWGDDDDEDDSKSIFHVAVENRLENVFNLINEIGKLNEFSTKYRTFKGKYSILHLAGNLAAPNHLNRVSGAALQMQREMLWFKEVEKIVLPSQLEVKSNDPDPSIPKLTPRQLFTEKHKRLRKEGEEWMKNTANSCMLVATLISTVVFAAAFTVPGGNDDNTGTPIFQNKFWFAMFVVSDAIALFSSSTSILMFLSILTSRYAEEDFLHSLPSKLLFGLASLFISIVFMAIAFSSTFFLIYHNANISIPTMVTAMAIIPITCFCLLQFTLWIDIFHNTYSSRFLFNPNNPRKLF